MYKKVIVTVTCMKDQMLDHPNFFNIVSPYLHIQHSDIDLFMFFFNIVIFTLLKNYIVLNISWHVVIGKWVA